MHKSNNSSYDSTNDWMTEAAQNCLYKLQDSDAILFSQQEKEFFKETLQKIGEQTAPLNSLLATELLPFAGETQEEDSIIMIE